MVTGHQVGMRAVKICSPSQYITGAMLPSKRSTSKAPTSILRHYLLVHVLKPFLSAKPQPDPLLPVYELGLNQPTQILAADEDPTNPLRPLALNTEGLAETMAHGPDTEHQGCVAYTASSWSRNRGGDGDVPGTSPGASPRHGDRHRRIRGKHEKRRARKTPDSKQPIESHAPGSDVRTAIHDSFDNQELDSSFQASSDKETKVINEQVADTPAIKIENTDPSVLPVCHPWDSQAEVSHISYYTERGHGDISYLAPPNLSCPGSELGLRPSTSKRAQSIQAIFHTNHILNS